MKNALLALSWGAIALATSTAAVAEVGVTVTTPGRLFQNGGSEPYTFGYWFQVTAPITVRALGTYDYENGAGPQPLVDDVPVGLWTEIGSTYTFHMLATTTVPAGAGATLIGDFYYADIRPTVLTPGNWYLVGTQDANGYLTTFNVGYGGAATIGPDLTLVYDAYNYDVNLTVPDLSESHTPGAWLGGNIEYTIGAPEPAAWMLMTLGLAGVGAGLRRRHGVRATL